MEIRMKYDRKEIGREKETAIEIERPQYKASKKVMRDVLALSTELVKGETIQGSLTERIEFSHTLVGQYNEYMYELNGNIISKQDTEVRTELLNNTELMILQLEFENYTNNIEKESKSQLVKQCSQQDVLVMFEEIGQRIDSVDDLGEIKKTNDAIIGIIGAALEYNKEYLTKVYLMESNVMEKWWIKRIGFGKLIKKIFVKVLGLLRSGDDEEVKAAIEASGILTHGEVEDFSKEFTEGKSKIISKAVDPTHAELVEQLGVYTEMAYMMKDENQQEYVKVMVVLGSIEMAVQIASDNRDYKTLISITTNTEVIDSDKQIEVLMEHFGEEFIVELLEYYKNNNKFYSFFKFCRNYSKNHMVKRCIEDYISANQAVPQLTDLKWIVFDEQDCYYSAVAKTKNIDTQRVCIGLSSLNKINVESSIININTLFYELSQMFGNYSFDELISIKMKKTDSNLYSQLSSWYLEVKEGHKIIDVDKLVVLLLNLEPPILSDSNPELPSIMGLILDKSALFVLSLELLLSTTVNSHQRNSDAYFRMKTLSQFEYLMNYALLKLFTNNADQKILTSGTKYHTVSTLSRVCEYFKPTLQKKSLFKQYYNPPTQIYSFFIQNDIEKSIAVNGNEKTTRDGNRTDINDLSILLNKDINSQLVVLKPLLNHRLFVDFISFCLTPLIGISSGNC
ncbi:hypothetical protein AX774_g7759 [Zancudomyces culisetae]|uniref:Uncharacterized protein n=1 Tax=Zancudomyces culisetae TaxID=1213189 RepID=A0A1R1PCY9_ZANCU|nr:hypothetical protein AX774_g7759 [Zancudomyces culisetae]|eukprot:OMH78846.1 hypothetical protein AX774_g7759 [Zancudomyces culisetae]